MWEKLESLEDRYEELTRLMAKPEVATDHTQVAELAREQRELEDIVTLYREHRATAEELEETRTLLDGEDPEIQQLAEAEVEKLEKRLKMVRQRLRLLLLPKDPRDERNVIVEIRAGTGGDEAGLFAADLYRMYTRYAERKGWHPDLLTSHATGIGGFKEVIFQVKGKGAFSRLKYESGV
ncbi:MAG: PCRF domain-containing protein, partial [Anaerolineae bacterium]